MGVLFLAEKFTFYDLLGLVLILIGMAIATGMYKRFVRS